MNPYGWQFTKKVALVAGAFTLELPANRPILEKLTVWATSGARTVGAATFQLRVNGEDFGAAGAPGAGVISDVVIALPADQLLPAPPRQGNAPGTVDPFLVDIEIAGVGTDEFTLFMAGIGYAGGN